MNLRENPIYLRGGRRRSARSVSLTQIGTFLAVALVMLVNYYVFLRDEPSPPPPSLEKKINKKSEPPTPDRRPQRDGADPAVVPGVPEGGAVLAGRLERGQTLLVALQKQGAPQKALLPYITEMQKVFDFRTARVGDQYRLVVAQSGDIARLEYDTGPLDRYVVRQEEGDIVAIKRAVQTRTELVEVGCAIKSSIYESFQRCGERAALASRFVDILAWDVDFFQDIRKGDEFKVVVEKKTVDGEQFAGYGNILALEYTGKFGQQRLFWFDDPDGEASGYYKEDGKAARKEFIKTPLKFTRISSGYSHNRFHPVLHKLKKHLAVDYAAPVGTPVWSVAAGTVTYAGPKGPSGNLVAVQHANGYTTYYAHLQKFAKGIKVGARIDQKSPIGNVGVTGRTTGAHLHFALKHKGRFVNPQTVKYTTANPVPVEHLEAYKEMVEERLKQLEAIKVVGIDETKA